MRNFRTDGISSAATPPSGSACGTPVTAEGESVRLGAVRSILEPGGKLRENVEMEERLAELERCVETKHG